MHDDLARVEIAAGELDKILNKEAAEKLSKKFKSLGFRYITLDLTGFRSGSMNDDNSSRNNLEN